MWRWPWLILLAVCFWLVPTQVLAETSAEVTVTATGYVCDAPGGFTVTYISDYEVGLSWTKGDGAENTMVRAKYGSMPESREDGYLVYYGNGNYTSDTGVSLDETASDIYYRAWSQNSNEVWEEEGTGSFWENIYVVTIGLIVLALGIAGIAIWRKHFFLYLTGFIGLLVIAVYLSEISWIYGLPIGLFSGYMLWECVTWWF